MFRSKISDVCIKDQYTLLEGAMGIVPKCTKTRPQNAHLCGLIGRFGDISAFWGVNSAEWRVKYVAGGDGGGSRLFASWGFGLWNRMRMITWNGAELIAWAYPLEPYNL